MALDGAAHDDAAVGVMVTDTERSVTDTAELRWFADGQVPADVVAWFSRAGSAGATEERSDTYRLDRRPDTGVKRRSREVLELKLRRAIERPRLNLTPGLGGALEVWRRWSPADGLVEARPGMQWTDVHKMVIKRRFSVTGSELVVTSGEPAPGGCDVELVAIDVGPVAAWSFAFAAYGQREMRRSGITRAWQQLVSESGPPDGFEAALGVPRGYPRWLMELTHLGEVAPLHRGQPELVS